MDKPMKTSWWQAHRPMTRRLVQLYSALLHNAYIKGFIDGKIYTGNAKYACVPGFNCYSCPGAVGSCPLGSIQNALASAGHRAGWYVLGIILLFGVILGRTICGWLCPLGLIQELLHKIPVPKLKKSPVTRALSWLKYVILAVFVIAVPLWYGLRYQIPLPGFCKYICPAGTFEGAIGHLANPANTSYYRMLGILFTRKFVIMLVIGLACVFCYRSFCRFICPLGAIYGLFSRFNVIGVKVDANRCNHCGACVRHCDMDVRRVGDHECIHCGKCMDVCNQGAISIQAGRITLKAPKQGCENDAPDAPQKRRRLSRILWGVALVILCFALVWFNFLDPVVRNDVQQEKAANVAMTAEPAEVEETDDIEVPAVTEAPVIEEAPVEEVQVEVSYDSDAPIGHEVGQKLEDFTLQCYDGSEFHLADMRGRIVFINLWATHCTPCIHELPYFSELYSAHEGDIAMIAVHSKLVTMDPVAFLADKGYAMPFATDTDDAVNSIVGGTGTLPQTIVLNRKGEVIYNQVGSVTPEVLSALYDEADASAPGGTIPAVEETPVEEAQTEVSYDSDAPIGHDVGQQLEDFTLQCYDGSEFHLTDMRGRIVFINLWATHCTPCIHELPYFSDLYTAHEGDIAMIAVHSKLVTMDPVAFLADKDFTMPFATDTDDAVNSIVGGTGTLPQTIVLNRRGEVIYNQIGSVTPEVLAALYDEADK